VEEAPVAVDEEIETPATDAETPEAT
jgi:hypothetical protein